MAGEPEILGAATMGAGPDIDHATEAVMTLIRYGLSAERGVLGIDKLADGDRGERLKDDYNALTRVRLAECQRRADGLVRANSDAILRLARHLDVAGHLAGDALQSALADALAR